MGIAGLSARKQIVRVVVVAASLLVFAAAVQAAAFKARNWPNTPVRHTLKQHVRATVPSFAANLRGGVAVAGNTLETCDQNSPGSEACTTANNNDKNMVYVNVDPGAQVSPGVRERFNSSTANLAVPAGAHVVKAFLYWAADLSRGVVNGSNRRTGSAAPDGDTPQGKPPHTADTPHKINDLYATVKLRVGGGAAYSTINAFAQDPTQGRWDSVSSWYSTAPSAGSPEGGSPGWAYQVRADVTDQISAGLASRARRKGAKATLPVTVANVQAGTGLNRYAGWNLIVVWEQPAAAWRDITLFDGFDWVQVEGGQQLVVGPLDFTGFRTPSSGNIDAHVTVWATEGDRGLTGDYMSLGNQSPDCGTLAKQRDLPARPVDNFFNSTISSGGIDVGGRSPNYSNQLGFDLATLAVPEGTIGNNKTGASVCLGTTGDTYFFGGLVFDTLIKAPNLAIAKVSDHTNANPGAVVNYTTTVSNPSTRAENDPLHGVLVTAATNVVVADQLPSGLDFDGFTQGSDKCAYGAPARTITCTVGTLAPDDKFTYSYNSVVAASAQGPNPATLVNNACYDANSEDQPDVVFHGCDPAAVVVPPVQPAPKPADLGVVKTVSHDVVKPGATLTWNIVGTNYGPATSTGFTLADQLPPGVQFVSATASPALTCTTPPVGTSGSVTCTAPSVPPAPAAGSSLTLTIVATVPDTTADGTLLANVATVSGEQNEPLPDPHPNRDQTLTSVIVPDQPVPPQPIPPLPNPPLPPEPEGPPQPPVLPVHPPRVPGAPADTLLKIHKAGTPATATLGDTIGYTLRVSNVGEALATNVRVCDTPPSGLAIVSAPGFSRSGRSVCATINKIQIGKSKTLHLTARVTTTSAGRLSNEATAKATNAPSTRTRTSTRIVAPRPPPPGLG